MSQRHQKTASVIVVGWIFVVVGLIGAGSCLYLYRYWTTVPANYQWTRDPRDFIGKEMWITARFHPEEAIMTNPHPVPRIRELYLQWILKGTMFFLFGIGLLSRRETGRKFCLALLLILMLWRGTGICISHTTVSREVILDLIRGLGIPLFLLWWLVSPGGKAQFQGRAEQ